MEKVKGRLHEKRARTEEHIRSLQDRGKAGIRYTLTLPDLRMLAFGLLCDAGWLLQLVFGIRLIRQSGLHGSNKLVLFSLVCVIVSVGMIVYLSLIHEKEMATGLQRDLSFTLIVCAGIAGALAGLWHLCAHGLSVSAAVFLAGSVLNAAAGLPIRLSFRKGIIYGIR